MQGVPFFLEGEEVGEGGFFGAGGPVEHEEEDGGEAVAEDFLPLAEVVDVFAGGPVLEGGGAAFAVPGGGEFAAFDVDEEVFAGGAVDHEVEGFQFGAGEEGFLGFIDGDVGEAFLAEVIFERGFVVDDFFAARAHGGSSVGAVLPVRWVLYRAGWGLPMAAGES